MSTAQDAPRVEPDVRCEHAGSFVLVTPETRAACRWMRRHLDHAETTWHGISLVAEPRYVMDLVQAMRGAGLVVEALR